MNIGDMKHLRSIEDTLLGCCMRDLNAIPSAVKRTKPSEFSTFAGGQVFSTIVGLWQDGKVPVVAQVADQLAMDGKLADVGGYPFLGRCIELAPTAANADQWADTVHDWWLRREVENACRAVINECEKPNGPAIDMIADLEKKIFSLAEAGYTDEPQPLKVGVFQMLDEYDRAKQGKSDGVKTSLDLLDHLTGGFHPGEMIVIAARPGVGKTALAVSILNGCSVSSDQNSLFVSLEQRHSEIARRFASVRRGIDSMYLRLGKLTTNGEISLNEVSDELCKGKVWTDDRPGQTILRISASARRLKAKVGLQLIVIDYLQLIMPEDRRQPRHEQVADISRRLKILARDLNVPVVALAQLNRGPEDRPEGKPRISDLRESGGIEADADVVLLMHRQHMTDPDGPLVPICVQVAKQRNGPTGEFDIAYRRQFTRFENFGEEGEVSS